MTPEFSALAHLTDADLLSEVKRLATHERQATVLLIGSLAELDARRLYLGEGCASLFTYCTQVLHFSEHAAYGRIAAARAARRFPVILDLLADGSLNLTTVGLIAPHLDENNHHGLLENIRHKCKREVESIVAALRPQPAVPTIVRKLPARKPTTPADRGAPTPAAMTAAPAPTSRAVVPAPPRPAVVKPLAPELYKMQLTVSRETYELLRRAQDLLRHSIPNGDPAAVVARALEALVGDLERKKLASAVRPRRGHPAESSTRYVPPSVRRQVWSRDGGQCAFVGTEGRCRERGFLEFHHLKPYADDGKTTVENLELRCQAHNAYEASLYFGSPEDG